jgi:serine/threonine-protein kinase
MATDSLRPRVEAALGESYEVQDEIGRGGMGVVYRARDRKLRRLVAIKVLPPELAYREEVRTRFLREAETAAQLSHPNIVPIYAVEEREGIVCFVMGLVEGLSLGAHLGRQPRLAYDEVKRILCDVADALDYAHRRGIIHRDIKPDNILLEQSTGRPLVTDFGIARAAEGDSRLTVTGMAVGTPAYMSPEQAMGEREVDGRSDIYSLGVVGYQMVAGELPHKASNTPAMLMKHLTERPRPLREVRPDVPPALAEVLDRALAKRPDDRWRDAGAMRDAVTGAGVEPVSGLLPGDESLPRGASAAWQRPAIREYPPPADPRQDRGAANDRAARPEHHPLVHRRRELDAVTAANAGMQNGTLPPLPPWMPSSWREARRQWEDPSHGAPDRRGLMRGRGRRGTPATTSPPSEADRIRAFRRRTASTAITVGMLGMINLVTSPEVPWFLFPTFFMGFGWVRGAAGLWADGISLRRVFGRKAREALAAGASAGAATPSALPPSLGELAARLAPAEVLAGPYGPAVRRAADDKQAAHEALARLSKADRELIPDVAPTVDALAERVGALAQALHRLDEDVTPVQAEDLDRRIAETRARPESPERDQRVELLERQRATLGDLLERRSKLAGQLESASLMLQNMRLDLLALRSAGVQSVLNDVSSATQEARALSRDIAHVLDAAREVRGTR